MEAIKFLYSTIYKNIINSVDEKLATGQDIILLLNFTEYKVPANISVLRWEIHENSMSIYWGVADKIGYLLLFMYKYIDVALLYKLKYNLRFKIL